MPQALSSRCGSGGANIAIVATTYCLGLRACKGFGFSAVQVLIDSPLPAATNPQKNKEREMKPPREQRERERESERRTHTHI